MASPSVVASQVGSITGVGDGGAQASRGGGSCSPGVIGGASILKFGRSLPLVELFEAFMIVGLVLLCVTASNYFAFHNIATILKNEGGVPSSVNMADAAASAQSVWIGVGALLFFLGIVLYYLHRRIQQSPS